MSDLSSALDPIVAPIFVDNQAAITTTYDDLESWTATVGMICCSIIVDKLNSEPCLSEVTTTFSTSSTYIGGANPSRSNRLEISYSMTDTNSPPCITEDDHTTLSQMNTAERENQVAQQISEHYNNTLRVKRVSYTHNNGLNKNLLLRLIKFETV